MIAVLPKPLVIMPFEIHSINYNFVNPVKCGENDLSILGRFSCGSSVCLITAEERMWMIW